MREKLDILSKYQPYFLGLAIFFSLLSVSITITEGQVNLNLRSYPLVMFLMVAVSIFLAIIYISIDKRRIRLLSKEVSLLATETDEKSKSIQNSLTSRQKEVYDLILAGKTNKEIKSTLFIEHSTLKSHINQIYKKLNVKSRKELKSKA